MGCVERIGAVWAGLFARRHLGGPLQSDRLVELTRGPWSPGSEGGQTLNHAAISSPDSYVGEEISLGLHAEGSILVIQKVCRLIN